MTDDQRPARRSCRAALPAARMRVRSRPGLVDPWLVVERRRSGLLRYARARGTVALPVTYAVRDRRVYVRLPVYNDACNFVDRADVALDVSIGSVGRVSIARLAGMGLVLPEGALPTGLAGQLETWPPDMPTRIVVLVTESVHQIPMADEARFPPLPRMGARLAGTETS